MWSEKRVPRNSELGKEGLEILLKEFSDSELRSSGTPVTFFCYSDGRIEITSGSYQKVICKESEEYGCIRRQLG